MSGDCRSDDIAVDDDAEEDEATPVVSVSAGGGGTEEDSLEESVENEQPCLDVSKGFSTSGASEVVTASMDVSFELSAAWISIPDVLESHPDVMGYDEEEDVASSRFISLFDLTLSPEGSSLLLEVSFNVRLDIGILVE